MNYFEKQTIYYTVLVAELLGKEYEEVFDKISAIYFQIDNQILRRILTDNTFQELKSTIALSMRINFIDSYCPVHSAFGNEISERESLYIKREAFSLIEELTKATTNVGAINILMRHQKDKDTFSSLVALLLYAQGRYDTHTVSSLGKALKGGDLNAGLILLFFAKNQQYELLFSEMIKVQEIYLYPEIMDMLIERYGFNRNKKAGNLLNSKQDIESGVDEI